MKLKDAGQYSESITEFKRIIESKNDTKKISDFMIAMLYLHELEDASSALPYARNAVKIRPNYESASLCLVHCLFDTNNKKEINEEIQRYINSGGEIKEYELLFQENGIEVSDFT